MIREEVVSNLREIQAELGDFTDLRKEIDRLEKERNSAVEKVQQHIDFNASVAQDQDQYQQKYDELTEQYQSVENSLSAAQETLRKNESRNDQIESFIEEEEALT